MADKEECIGDRSSDEEYEGLEMEDDEDYVQDNDEDEDGEEESNEDDENDGENAENVEYDPLQYLRLIRQILGRGGAYGLDYEEESTTPATPVPPPPPASLLDERIATDITNATRLFPDTPARPIPSMIMKREIYRKCPLSPHDRIHIAQRALPIHGRLLFQYDHHIFCGQYSRDGSVFMSAAQDSRVRLYNSDTWSPIKEIHARHVEWSVIDIDYSPDQRWIIYSSWSDYVHICNLHGDFEIHEGLDFRPDADRFCLFSIKFAPNSTEILGGSSDRNIYVYDIDRKERVIQQQAHQDDVNTVCFLDDTGNLIASGSDDRLVRVWDRRMLGAAGSSSSRSASGCVGVFAGHLQGITHLSAKGDGRYLISNGKDQCIKLWDVRNMLPPGAKINQPSNPRVDYRYGALSNRLFEYKPHPDDKSLQTYRGHRVYQTLIRSYFSPVNTTGQKYIYTGSYDGSVYIYDVLTAELVTKLEGGHMAIIRDLSWHPYDTQLVSTSWDGTMLNWSTEQQANPARAQARRRPRRYWDDE